ncbi:MULTISPECIES: hypothetical protein [unclassified Pseudomonas]|uniref:hypothetical protein n=1 Tax=unclassified Pseudomonas TaxID=196821 RepID=UPI000C181D68|nr:MULTISPECIES: hypothetical protein [unclassified Pseudomonas]PIK75661.1 hypothetical protein CQW31_25890 [Pseudomonas sp. 382]
MSVINEELLRSLPNLPDILAKLKSGEYELFGGVVRHAKGTERGGQIVGHLLFPGDSQQTQAQLQQLQDTLSNGLGSLQTGMDHLQQSMSVLQGLQTANLVMTGLNLAVTTAGFVIVCQKLNKISSQIQAQSQTIAETWNLVSEAHERGQLTDEAQFRSLLLSARQFCEEGDVQQLKALIPAFHKEYQFTKLILERHAAIPASTVQRLSDIKLLQDRLVNLGLALSHVQAKSGAVKYAHESLAQLEADIRTLNINRIEGLTSDRAAASAISQKQFADVTDFLQHGKQMMPALAYQAEVITLETKHPGLLQKASTSREIMFLAA